MSEQPIPDKLYFKIGEVSELTGIEPHVLRYWETEFKELRPHRAGSKQRLYRRADVEMVLAIKRLLYEEEFTIAGAKKFLGRRGKDEPGGEAAVGEPEGLLQEIRSELEELKRLLEK
ncbi:MAG TPA: MerR family transcriptional regulator [Candidatus Sulfotelmatobacter sp.]|nr:MerR family transcriptional regulator [Candidatus Sulfotelmatobacter sp.]